MLKILTLCCFLVHAGCEKEFCNKRVWWQKDLDIDRTQGLWFAVGYAQHNHDMSSDVADVGCVTVHITDTTREIPPSESTDWSEVDRQLWHARQTGTPALVHSIHQLSLRWDDDSGGTYEHTYRYSNASKGLWLPPPSQQGIWPSPDYPPRREVIKVILATSHLLVLNFCHDETAPRLFSLVFKRYPWKVTRSDWFRLRTMLQRHHLPPILREATVCDEQT